MASSRILSRLSWLLPPSLLTLLIVVALIVMFSFPWAASAEVSPLVAYCCQLSVVVVSLASVYFGLKLFRFKRLLPARVFSSKKTYLKWCRFRMAWLMLVSAMALWVAFWLEDVSLLWCALLVAVSGFFCLPDDTITFQEP